MLRLYIRSKFTGYGEVLLMMLIELDLEGTPVKSLMQSVSWITAEVQNQ